MGVDPISMAVIGLGLSAGSSAVGAYGRAQGQKFEAAQAKAAATAGRIAADQTDTVLNEELNSTLASIQAIRASAGVGSDSPTTMALMDQERRVQNRTRRIERGNRLRQANMDDASARFLRQSARVSLLGGALQTAGMAASGYGNIYGASSSGGGSPGAPHYRSLY